MAARNRTTATRRERRNVIGPAIRGGGRASPGALCVVLPRVMPSNPTAHASWRGARRPAIGSRRVFRMLFALGMVSVDTDAIAADLAARDGWTTPAIERLYRSVAKDGVYLTVLFKRLVHDERLEVGRARAELGSEIARARPRAIVLFGADTAAIAFGRSARAFTSSTWPGTQYPVHFVPYPVARAARFLLETRANLAPLLPRSRRKAGE